MKILITGGAGFIGKWLVEQLPTDVEIIIVDSLDEQVHKPIQEFASELLSRARCIKADVRDIEQYRAAAEGSDVIVHLASQTGTGQSMYEISRYVQQNVDGTAKLLELIGSLQKKPKRVILTSSRAVYGEGAFQNGTELYYVKGRKREDLENGKWEIYNESGMALKPVPMAEHHQPNPTSLYGYTKLWQEQLVDLHLKSQGIGYVIFRLQNVYGPKQELHNPYTGIIGIFTNSIVQKNRVELFEDGKMTRDFVYVEDVALALCKSIFCEGNISRIINLGSELATSLEKLVQVIARVTNKEPEINYSGRFRVGDIRHAVTDMKVYQELFGEWKPTSLEIGFKKYLDWYLNQTPPSESALYASFKEMEKKGLSAISKS